MPNNPRKGAKAYIESILNDNRSIGILLLFCSVLSLVISNLANGREWIRFWHGEIHFLHQLYLPHSPIHLINDGLMAIFFFVAGLEIRKEMAQGTLSSPQKAALPIVAAIGGMLVPALIYSFFNKGTEYIKGWAIPTATDIAFALGIASLVGRKLPSSLRSFLLALAVIDDLGAIVIIAFFYGGAVKPLALLMTLIVIVLIVLLNRRTKKFGRSQIGLSVLLWYAILQSGIHPTIAGVIFAFLVPGDKVRTYEHALLKPVYFIIIPIFALANTAIELAPNVVETAGSNVSIGIILGMLIGKPLGIFGATFLLVRNSKVELPLGISWSHIIGIGLLAGIGFTMSIFISSLAFSDYVALDVAKIAVLIGSFFSMAAGYFWLRAVRKEKIMV